MKNGWLLLQWIVIGEEITIQLEIQCLYFLRHINFLQIPLNFTPKFEYT